ncbi:MAG: Gfo/Idh/MocA family oxidoreductase [Planctomycetales bacterium]
MNLTPEQKLIGKQNYNAAVGAVSRRAFLKGAAAAVPGMGAAYFGYKELKGNPVRVGFIGTGDEGSVLITQHPPEYMQIVAIADLRPSNQRRAFEGSDEVNRIGLNRKLGADAAKGIKVYKNHKELLADKDIEAVVIAVPLNQHAQIAIDAMKAGKHVLTEKLMAHNITQCKEMIKVARETKKLLAVGHQRHYSVLYQNANDLVKEGLLGDIKFIRACWHRNNSWPNKRDSWNPPIAKEDTDLSDGMLKEFGYDSLEQLVHWRLYNKTGGGLMAELGSHQLDACSIFLGKVKPLAVYGYGGKNFYGVKGVGSEVSQKDTRECDDQVFVTIEFPGPHYAEDKNDIVIVTYSSINTNALEPYGETIFGSRGTMIVEMEQNVMLYKEIAPGGGGGGAGQSLKVENDKDSKKPALAAAESPQAAAAQAGPDLGGKVSRGYTEEMEHFCSCIRDNNFEPPDKGGLRCPGTVAMADAIMALTSNIAMKQHKRIEFKTEWFDPESPFVPEVEPKPTA